MKGSIEVESWVEELTEDDLSKINGEWMPTGVHLKTEEPDDPESDAEARQLT